MQTLPARGASLSHHASLTHGCHVGRPCRTANVSSPKVEATATSPTQTVDEVLRRVQGTDGGMTLTNQQRDEIDQLLDELAIAGRGTRPVKDARLFGNWNVDYTSIRRVRPGGGGGQPSGGRFRGAVGRAVFRTSGLFQSVLAPKDSPSPVATNKVAFRLFGVLAGYVGLRGKVQPVGDADDTVNVFFEPPVLCIADQLAVRIGRESSVQLTTTYLDDRVRVGQGSYGSLFVFTRGGAADHAGMDTVGRERSTPLGQAVLALVGACFVAAGLFLWASCHPVLRLGACMAWLLTAGVAAAFWQSRGGGATEAGLPLPA